jgi:hypothetical protein
MSLRACQHHTASSHSVIADLTACLSCGSPTCMTVAELVAPDITALLMLTRPPDGAGYG